MEENKKLWFRRKLYGWGWTPSSWEGWVVLGIYLLLLFRISIFIEDYQQNTKDVPIIFLLPIAVLTIILIFICYKKGEKPKWQWGKRVE